jgi:hypothetical protein
VIEGNLFRLIQLRSDRFEIILEGLLEICLESAREFARYHPSEKLDSIGKLYKILVALKSDYVSTLLIMW